eukprot:352987-Chlamydomonas_euryale.AAC.2
MKPRSRDRRPSRRTRSGSRSRSQGRDDYGGYKPRKTQTLQALPAVAVGPGTGSDPFAALRQQAAAQTPNTMDATAIQRLWQEQQLKAREMVLRQQAASAAQAASKTQREVYIGNLVAGAVSDTMLVQIFNTALAVRFPASSTPGMEPVIRANIHSSGKYAFVEFRTPEMATASLDLSGQVQFMGVAMTVARPAGYVDPGKAAAAAVHATAALSAFQQGGVAPGAMAGLPGMGLPGAGIPGIGLPGPVPGSTSPTGAAAALQSAAVAQNMATAMLPGPPSDVLRAGVPPPGPPPTTQFLEVTGMVTASVLADDSEYAEVIDDLREECNRHAPNSVISVKVPRPPQPAHSGAYFGQGNFGKV